MSDKIKEALKKLDVNNENHWTQDGSPRLETVKFNNGGEAISREEIEESFPGFNQTTAAGYWMAQGAAVAAETPASGTDSGATPVAPVAPENEANETPSEGGEGATPTEQKAPANDSAGGDANSETELPEVEAGDDSEPDEIQALETTFQEIQEHLTSLRGEVDNINLEIDRVAQIEQKVSDKMNRAKRDRGDHKPANAIQEYLARQKKISIARGEARKAIAQSGVSLKELAKITGKSPLDQSMARPSGRGRGSRGM